ncbi:MAG: hypothetical protein LQ338_006117 [Usnochroma carphineum]|nr:MAG: hypothetical protein LQ338_006117 [Usnochroma carphineum]
MPRRSTIHEQPLPPKTLVVDNGAYTIKAGFAAPVPDASDCHVIPNCIARERDKKVWVGAELESCRDFGEMAFRRPVEKGYLVNWEVEKTIWDSIFLDGRSKLYCDPHSTNLILTEASNTMAALQTNCDQVVFEEYGFASYSRHIGPTLNAYNDIQHLFGAPPREQQTSATPAECVLVIDSGFSHSTVTPVYKSRPIQQAIRRLDIGGKILTNYLKEMLSIRHYNLMNEEHLVNEAKEKVCFVSNDFRHDLERTWQGGAAKKKDGEEEIVVDYVLPDYNTGTKGSMRPHDPSMAAQVKKMGAMANAGGAVEDFMTLGNERFTVPELLFNPMDVGMKEAGLPETVMQSLSGLPPGLWPAMLANIVVVGGNCLMDGFMERLETEIRQLAPADCVVRVARAPDPIKSTWLGGANLATDYPAMKAMQVTRQEYLEHGSGWVSRIFNHTATR